MIGVLFRFQIQDQRRESHDSQGGRRKNSSFKTRRGAVVQDFLWRPRGITQVVRQFVEKLLNASWRFQSTQLAQLRVRETEAVSAWHDRSSNIAGLFSLLFRDACKNPQSFVCKTLRTSVLTDHECCDGGNLGCAGKLHQKRAVVPVFQGCWIFRGTTLDF